MTPPPASSGRHALVFDLDGTVVESAPDLMASLNTALTGAGRRAVSLDEVKSMIGDGMPTLVARGFEATGGLPEQAALSDAVAACNDHYLAHPVVHTYVYPGAEQTLRDFAAAGHPLAICTNKPLAPALKVLDALGLGDLFSVVVGGDSFAYRKPDARMLTATLDQLGVSAGQAVMIGDSNNDARVAHNAGVPFAFVTFGYCTTPLAELAPAVMADHFAELPARLAAWWAQGRTARSESLSGEEDCSGLA